MELSFYANTQILIATIISKLVCFGKNNKVPFSRVYLAYSLHQFKLFFSNLGVGRDFFTEERATSLVSNSRVHIDSLLATNVAVRGYRSSINLDNFLNDFLFINCSIYDPLLTKITASS